MRTRYFKRYRMEIDLPGPPPPPAPAGYALAPWSDLLLETHAAVKFACFIDELDAIVFPSLSDRQGCRQLMTAIRQRSGFHAPSTWLMSGPDGPCATIQGLRD